MATETAVATATKMMPASRTCDKNKEARKIAPRTRRAATFLRRSFNAREPHSLRWSPITGSHWPNDNSVYRSSSVATNQYGSSLPYTAKRAIRQVTSDTHDHIRLIRLLSVLFSKDGAAGLGIPHLRDSHIVSLSYKE